MAIRLVVSSTAPFVLAFLMANVRVAWSLIIAAVIGAIGVLALIAIGRLAHSPDRSRPALSRAKT